MACLLHHLTVTVAAIYTGGGGGGGGGEKSNKQKLNCVKVNGSKSFAAAKMDLLRQQDHSIPLPSSGRVDEDVEVDVLEEHFRQNIPTMKQMVDPYRQGLIVEEGVGYRQTVVIRSYEVGPDKTATIESLLNLLQETALNHVWMSGLLSDGFGATHGMMRNNLIWVVSRMRVQVDHYPIWGEVMEIDTWVGASGKNGMRRDWLLRSKATGLVFVRGTSTWVMMNQQTRRLSKMPDEVRAEIAPWFIEKNAIEDESQEKIEKLDANARFVHSNLKPKRSDLDMNHHVNNVKYLRWMLETIPNEFLEKHQLLDITLEYRRECGSSDVVESLCQPQFDEKTGVNRHSGSSQILEGNGKVGTLKQRPLSYTHLLQTKGENKNEEMGHYRDRESIYVEKHKPKTGSFHLVRKSGRNLCANKPSVPLLRLKFSGGKQ